VAYPLELEAEQQDEGAGAADADGHGAVGEAALEELPSLVVAEEVGRMPVWTRTCRR
jgi:hypothetical protein